MASIIDRLLGRTETGLTVVEPEVIEAKAVTGPGAFAMSYGTPLHSFSRDPHRLMAEAMTLFHTNGWVGACERALGGRFVRMGWHLEDENGDTVDEKSPAPYQVPWRLLERSSGKTRAKLWGVTFRHVGLAGNGCWFLDQRDGLAGTPLDLMYINPARMTPAIDAGGNVIGWVLDHPENQVLNRLGANYSRSGVPMTTEEVIHFTMDEPDWGIWGIGIAESAQRKIALDDVAAVHLGGVLGSGGRLTGLVTPKVGSSVSEDQWVQFVRDWRSIASDPDAAKRLQIAQMPLDFTQMSVSPKDLELSSIHKQNRDDIFALWGLPLGQRGIDTSAGLNADRAMGDEATAWETVKERSEPIRESIQYELLDRWQALGVKVTLVFDYPTFDDSTPLYEQVEKSVYAAITNDERRNILGLEPLEDAELGKAIYVHVDLSRIDVEPEPGPVDVPSTVIQIDADDDEAEGKARLGDSLGTLRSRLARKWEPRFKALLDRVLAEQRSYIAGRAEHIKRKPSDTSSWWDQKREDARLANELNVVLEEFGREVSGKSRSLVGVAKASAKAEPMMFETILTDLKREAGARITNINETTRDAVRQTIADHLTGKELLDPSPAALAGLIRGATMQNGQPVFGEYRSELISRTETAHLYNTAALGTYREMGVEEVDAIDGDHDAACAARNGKRFLASEAQGVTDHPNGTLDWVPVVNEDRRRSAGEDEDEEEVVQDAPARAAPAENPDAPRAVLGEPFPTKAPYADTGWAEPFGNVTLKSGTEVRLSGYGDAVPGGYNGGWAVYDKSGNKMGFLDYQSASGEGSVTIGMIEVAPAYQGKGVSDALLSRLVTEFPGAKIDPGMMTEAGSAWWQRVKQFVPHVGD